MVARALVAVLVAGFAFAGTAQAKPTLTLRGNDVEQVRGGVERDAIRASGPGATLVLRGRVACWLREAACYELHGRQPQGRRCEDAYGYGELRLRGGSLPFFATGRICPHPVSDVQTGMLWVHRGTGRYAGFSGVLSYRMTARWRGAHGRTERVKITIERPRAKAASAAVSSCHLCEFLVNYGHSLGPHATEQEIEHAFRRVCGLMPTGYQGACHDFLASHGQFLSVLIARRHDSTDVCRHVHACTAEADRPNGTTARC